MDNRREMPMPKNGQVGMIDYATRMVEVTGSCYVTKESYSIMVPLDGLLDWIEGKATIQVALPDLSAADREFLISGTSPKGWDQLMLSGALGPQ